MAASVVDGEAVEFVADDDPFLQVDDRLGDFGGVVGDSFEVPRVFINWSQASNCPGC